MTTDHRHSIFTALAAATLLAGCGAASVSDASLDGKHIGAGAEALTADNGLNRNGLNRNGLNRNGLNRNGLNRNGLNTGSDFSTWFNEDPVTSDAVMRYVYACAAPAGSTLSWYNSKTKKTSLWVGVFGLAPGWVGGAQATTAEQQLVTACLAAHVNKYGLSVPIAVEGRTATGAQIPVEPGELTTYSFKEACFFGNLFADEGVFLAFDRGNWPATSSSVRACAVDINGVSVDCSPIVVTGAECRDVCSGNTGGTFWESCSWNGKTYKPITTRIDPADVYTCGDGVCQVTERCGTGTTADSCLADCGPCWDGGPYVTE
jgi:hypothetical protein